MILLHEHNGGLLSTSKSIWLVLAIQYQYNYDLVGCHIARPNRMLVSFAHL